jgi:hypothetical protein
MLFFPRCFRRWLFAVVLLLGSALSSWALVPKDFAVQLSASVNSSAPRITLSWPLDPLAVHYEISRKKQDGTQWNLLAVMTGSSITYADSRVSVGTIYEYRVKEIAPGRVAHGYIATAIDYPLVEDRGNILLIVESSIAPSLATELAQLQQDLLGDGWTVIRHEVASTDSVPSVKNWIVSQYNASPARTNCVLLFGHVPVPYSGDFAPDGHYQHKGAWPADTYYADINGRWTDNQVRDKSAVRAANRNVPGDGKFDQSTIPGKAELQVGRVDLSRMSLFFPQTETDLLRQYLQRDHAFRTGQLAVPRRAFIDDNFGLFNGHPLAASAWSDFSVLVGAANISTGDWQTKLSAGSYLLAYGSGAGNYGFCNGIGDSKTFTTTPSYAVFTLLLGSYFGDWDNDSNFLRVMLANGGSGLTCAWSGRPDWIFHYMALGFPIGYCTKLSENNRGLYAALSFQHGVHMGLMGDPTLRLLPVLPPGNLTATAQGGGGVLLSWEASPDNVLGYAIYRAESADGPFNRLNDALVTDVSFTDAAGTGSEFYMVRAVKRQNSPAGTYFNASQGIFAPDLVTQP